MGNDDNEEEDDEMLMAASAWASALDQDGDDERIRSTDDIKNEENNVETKKEEPINDTGSETHKGREIFRDDSDNTQNNKQTSVTSTTAYSLHLKNVPYDASQSDIRFAFLEKRCNVTSVRLVYDRDQKTGEKHFRGVAFVDLADEESYRRGISELHNTTFLGKGRRVSVRPTRTKSELSDIVRRTEEKVANLIARSKELKKDAAGGAVVGGGVEDKDDSTALGTTKKDKKKNKRRRSEGADINAHQSSIADKKSSTNFRENTRASATDSGHKKQKKEIKMSAVPKGPTKNDAKSDGTTSSKLPEQLHSGDADESLVSPGSKKREKKAKKREASSKHEKRSRTKSEESSPIKLTKKQRAKKAAVLRMLKFKRKKS